MVSLEALAPNTTLVNILLINFTSTYWRNSYWCKIIVQIYLQTEWECLECLQNTFSLIIWGKQIFIKHTLRQTFSQFCSCLFFSISSNLAHVYKLFSILYTNAIFYSMQLPFAAEIYIYNMVNKLISSRWLRPVSVQIYLGCHVGCPITQ